MSNRLLARIRKLENRRTRQGANRIITYDPTQQNRASLSSQRVGTPGKYMLVPNYSTNSDWERALNQQQCELLRHGQANTSLQTFRINSNFSK